MSVNLTFLIYDSRSGSTYLSRKLDEQFSDVMVTPEINLVYAIKAFDQGVPDWKHFSEMLSRGRFFSSLGFEPDELESIYEPSNPHAFQSFLATALERYAAQRGRIGMKNIVIKKGDHFKVADRIIKLIPNAQFIYLRRDPRAIYESKKRTSRPYMAWESMAWAGVLAASIRWYQYEKFAEKLYLKDCIKVVSFEQLATQEQEVLEGLRIYLGVSDLNEAQSSYVVAEKERMIHQKAFEPGIISSELSAWKDNLTPYEATLIEIISATRMEKAGYRIRKPKGCWTFSIIPIAMIEMFFKVIYTYTQRLFYNMKNKLANIR